MNEDNKFYTLGGSEKEQERLNKQSDLYGDRKYLNFKENDTVCEVGCGSGANLWIAKLLTHGFFIGIDIQQSQIETSQKKSKTQQLTNTKFICSDAHKLPLESESVSVAFCRLVLIHIPDPIAVIKEMCRITKPSGRVIAIEPDAEQYKSSKPALNKCFLARTNYAYRPGNGSINVTQNLYSIFHNGGLENITLKKHEIIVNGCEKELLKELLINWLIMIESVINPLLKEKYITKLDFDNAKQEVEEISDEDYVYQYLWVAEGNKPRM